MQLGIESQIPDGLLATNALLAENSRQGLPTSTQTLYQGFEFAISSTVLGFQFGCSESASYPVDAPNKPTKGQCLGQALAEDGNGVSLGLDVAGVAAGFLPGGGLVTGSARAANIAFGAQVGLTAASTGVSVGYRSGPGIVLGILGGQVALTAKTAEALGEDAVEAFGESIPIVGVAVSTGALLYDGYQTYKAYSGCLSGVHE
jgi:hypothetical protein